MFASTTRGKALLCLPIAVLLLLGPTESFTPSLSKQLASSQQYQPSYSSRIRRYHGDCHVHRNPYKRVSSPRSSPLRLSALSSIPASLGGVETIYMLLLALQFAFQPILTKTFAPPNIVKSTYVMAQDLVRVIIGLSLLFLTGSFGTATANWSLTGAWLAAGFPAGLYALQNYCSLTAYQNLSPMAYNVLNQTKTLSAAVWCYVLMRQLQSRLQVVSLFVLLLAALVMEKVVPLPFSKENKKLSEPVQLESSTKKEDATTHWKSGVLNVLAASLISGLAGAWTQKTLQHAQRNNSLFLSVEMAAFSALLLLSSLAAGSPDRSRVQKEGWTVGWTGKTWIPIVTNAGGGVLVGLVTKYSGSVRKGFALILGMFLSGLLQNYLQAKDDEGGKVTAQQWVGGFLAGVSLWMHSTFPYAAP